jgi:hypothetical protein
VSKISFWHCASIRKNATEQVISNIRQYHPDSYYFLCVDATESYEKMADKYQCDYLYCNEKLGYPDASYGYDLNRVLEFLRRFHIACIRCKTDHIMMVEDDVWLLNPVTINTDWEMACHHITHGNVIPDSVIGMIQQYSGKMPLTKHYCGAGGSIFNVKTFVDNYDNIIKFFKDNFDHIQKELYPTIGWIDCFMVVYFYLCGKDLSVNNNLVDTHNHAPGFDYESFVTGLPSNIEIVNNYKKFYW